MTFFFTGLFFASLYVSGLHIVETRKFSISPKFGFLSSLLLVSALVASLFLAYGLFHNSRSLWYFQKSFHALNTEKKTDLSKDYIMKAIGSVPYDLYYRALSEIELVKLGEVINQDPKVVKAEDVQKQFGDVLSNAIKAAMSAKNTDPSNYLNWLNLGRLYETVSASDLKIAGAYESGEISYNEALKRSPKNPSILVSLSRLSASQGDFTKAREYVLKAVQIKNNYLEAYFILSQIEVSANNIKGAIDAVTASSIIDPTNPATFFQLGLLKYNQKDWVGAVAALEKAVSIVSDYANAKYFLGLSYEAVGEREKAIKEFSELNISNPENEEVRVMLNNLKEGKPALTDTQNENPEKSENLPIEETLE